MTSSAETTDNVRATPADRPVAFFRAFLTTFLVAIALVASLNLAVDPYGQYGTGMVPPMVRASRAEKLAQIAMARPAGLVLGSSRVMKLETAELTSRTGLPFFNAGVYFGRPEDYLAITRASREALGEWPKMLVVGVDVDAFVESPGPDAELLRDPKLRAVAADSLSIADRLRPLRELLSWKQSLSSLRSLATDRKEMSDGGRDETFAPTGEIVYHRRDRERAAGTYDFAAALADSRRDYTRLYAGYTRLCPRRVAAWRTLCELCEREGIALHAFVTTWQPELAAVLDKTSRLAERRVEVVGLLEETAPRGGSVRDFSDLASFGGAAGDFVDGVHPTETNTRRMIAKLLGRNQEGGRLAVQ
jgi:hypothetical protein